MSTHLNRPVLAVDSDDVVKAFNIAFSQYMGEVTGRQLAYEDLYTFRFKELYQMSKDEVMAHVRVFCHHHHDRIEPVSGVLAGLAALAPHFDQQIVTARSESIRDITIDWHIKNETSQYFSRFHFTNEGSKTATCQQIGAVAIIDDAIHNVVDAAKVGIPGILFDKPWNQCDDRELPGLVTRVYSWPQVVEEAMKLL